MYVYTSTSIFIVNVIVLRLRTAPVTFLLLAFVRVRVRVVYRVWAGSVFLSSALALPFFMHVRPVLPSKVHTSR